MSLSRCIDIEINGVQYPFHFGMQAMNKMARLHKWDDDPAMDIASRLLTVGGSQKIQVEFHKIAATIGATMSGKDQKPPIDSDIEDAFFKIVGITQDDVYPSFMMDMGLDVKPMIAKIKERLKSGEADPK